MRRYFPIRVGLVLTSAMIMADGAWLAGQTPQKPSAAVSSLPAVPPTGAMDLATSDASAKQAARHLDVSYSDGKLVVDATNASLNEILREVSQKTGIKVTGRVEDDRVFGHYGPSSPAMLLDELLEGTGSNVLLVAAAERAPGKAGQGDLPGSSTIVGSELILTPRRGGASPPSSNASAQGGDPESGTGQYVPPARPYQLPVPNGRNVLAAPGGDGLQTPGGDGSDSNGPKTPQQIYDQLQRTMQRQQQTSPQQ